jgi:hypothetical protein
MKTVIVSTRARTLNALLKEAEDGGLILRAPDGREFIVAEIDDFDREIELTRKNKKLMKLLEQRGKQSKTVGLAEVKAQLGLDRPPREKKTRPREG